MAVTTVVATAVAAVGGTGAIGGIVVLLLIALLVTKELAGRIPTPRLVALQKILTIALVPIGVAGIVALVEQLGAVL